MSNPIKTLRTALDLNQEDFAREIGRSHQSVRNYERGIEPPPEVLKRIEDLADKHGLKELFAPAQPEQSPAPRPGSSSDNQHWRDLLEEILASGDEEAISLVKDGLVVASKFARLSRASRLREKTG